MITIGPLEKSLLERLIRHAKGILSSIEDYVNSVHAAQQKKENQPHNSRPLQ